MHFNTMVVLIFVDVTVNLQLHLCDTGPNKHLLTFVGLIGGFCPQFIIVVSLL